MTFLRPLPVLPKPQDYAGGAPARKSQHKIPARPDPAQPGQTQPTPALPDLARPDLARPGPARSDLTPHPPGPRGLENIPIPRGVAQQPMPVRNGAHCLLLAWRCRTNCASQTNLYSPHMRRSLGAGAAAQAGPKNGFTA